MKIFKNNKGLSRLEFLCIIGICILLIIIIVWGIDYYRESLASGNDTLRMNTAESVATNNILSSKCVVDNCKGGDECTHVDTNGYTEGYYDSTTHHIVDKKMKGYNESDQKYTPREDEIDTGEPGSLIIMVTGKGSDIKLTWVEGEN